MGRKSYDTPDRIGSEVGNYVITRQSDLKTDTGFECVATLQEALEKCKDQHEVFVLGGGEIFKEAIGIADCIHLTLVHGIFEGDAFFPEIPATYSLINQTYYSADDRHAFAYSFLIYEKSR